MSFSFKSRCHFISQKWVFTILASIGLALQSIFSVMMAITIIEMVVRTETHSEPGNISCPISITSVNGTIFNSQIDHRISVERYPWDEYTQGVILSSFSWSCAIAQSFYGILAERFGGKHFLGFGILAQAILTFITPFVINWGGSTALIMTRFSMGLASDGMFAICNTMIPHWSTATDRMKIGNTIYAGSVLGLFFGNIIPALLIKYSGGGWPAAFHFVGIAGMIWFPLWQMFVYENPEVHRFITDEEKQNLRKNSLSEVKKVPNKLPPAPWRHIIMCKEFWAYVIGYMGCNCAYYLMLSGLPRYMGNVVNFPIESNGYLSSFSFLVMWLNTILCAWLSDKLVKNQWISLTNMRKLLTTVAVVGPAIFLLLASYAECDKKMVVTMFIVGIAMTGSIYPSLFMNPIDLSPNYAGSLTSVGSGLAQVVAILAPYLVGILVPNSTITEWRLVFWIVFSCAMVSNSAYLVWFKAEVQPWNEPKFISNDTKSLKEKEEVELKLMS